MKVSNATTHTRLLTDYQSRKKPNPAPRRKEPPPLEKTMTDGANTLSLADQIAAFGESMSKVVPAEVKTALGEELKKLADSGIAQNALKTGAVAPDFILPDSAGKAVALADFLAKGPVVVTFYRGGWCPFCDLQLRSYQAVLPSIRELGAELIAISPQTLDYVLSDVEKKQLSFPVLSDRGNEVARRYGLVFKLSVVLQKLQESFKNPIPKFNGDESWELPMPGTFVVDRDGVVKLSHVDPNYTTRLEPSAILDALRKI